jgi:hypothetical protein
MAKEGVGAARRPDRGHDVRRVGARAIGGDGTQRPDTAEAGARTVGQIAYPGRGSLIRKGRVGLTKDAIRRIALEKLEVVYRDWNFHEPPFADFATEAGERREDARAFLIALVAALLGGLSDAIDRNNKVIAEALARRGRRWRRRDT